MFSVVAVVCRFTGFPVEAKVTEGISEAVSNEDVTTTTVDVGISCDVSTGGGGFDSDAIVEIEGMGSVEGGVGEFSVTV